MEFMAFVQMQSNWQAKVYSVYATKGGKERKWQHLEPWL